MADSSRSSLLSLQRLSSEWLLADVAAGMEGAAKELETALDEILDQDPDDGLAHLWRGSLAMLEGDTQGAERSFARAFELGQIGGVAIATRALNFAFAADPNKALEAISMARSSSGVAELVKQVEAYAQENLGDGELAAAILKEITDLDAPQWQSWVLSIQGRDRLEESFLFDREIERALAAVGSNEAAFAELALLRGDRALSEGRAADARRWLGYARSAGRDLPEVLLRVGLAHLAEGGNLRVAREALTAASVAAPGNADVQNALGCLEYRTGALELARDRFQLVVDLVPTPSKEEDGKVSAARVYAIAALEQIDRALGEEVWVDEFDRENGPQVLNNWEKHETYGINIEIRDEAVLFEGTQAFEPNGLTKLVRPIDSSQLARLRALLVIEPRARGRIGLRLAREEGGDEGEGLVVFRDLDGMIAVALNSSDPDEEPMVIRSDGSGEGLDNDHEIVPTEWPNDGEAHWLELRLPREELDESTASVYLDGALVFRGIPVPRLSRRGSTIVGVSVQADLDRRMRLGVEQIEIFRRRPKIERGGANR